MKELGLDGQRFEFTLTGMTGSEKVDSKLVDLVVKSIDDSVEVELCSVKTVVNMPISTSCIAKREDLVHWPHLRGIYIPSIEHGEVCLLIGLNERTTLFLPLELKTGGDNEPIAIRYSLGWTVMGPVGDQKEDRDCAVNFVFTKDGHVTQGNLLRGVLSRERISEETKKLKKDENETAQPFGSAECEPRFHVNFVQSEDDDVPTVHNETLDRQLEKLWKTDFRDSVVGTRTLLSVEVNKALTKIKQSLQRRDGHFQVRLPWREAPPYLPNNKVMAEQRLDLLRKWLSKDKDLHEKYCSAIQDHLTKGHAEKVPENELDTK